MDETKMAALDLLQGLFKSVRIVLLLEIIRNPISQRGESASVPRMVMVKIHKIFKRSFNAILFGIKVPWRARLHLDCKSANPSHIGISLTDHLLKPNRLLDIHLSFKRHAEGKEKVQEHPV